MAKNNYVSPTLTGYNANPPADDGTQTEDNRVKWDTVKTKIGDPLNTYSSAVDSAVDAALDKLPNNSTTSQATNFGVSTGDDGKIFLVTGNSTASLPSAATVGAGFQATIKKNETGNTVTIDPDGSDTIDGETTRTITEPFEGVTLVSDGSSNWTIASDGRREIPFQPNFIDGFPLANNSTDSAHDIDIGAGSGRDGDDGGNIVISSTIVKQIDSAFAEGTGQGGLDTGTVAASTTYYIWAIAKASDGTSDVLYSLSDTSPTMPSGFDLKRRIGTIITDSGSDILNDWFVRVKNWGEQLETDFESVGTSTTYTVWDDFPSDLTEIELHIRDVSLDNSNETVIVQIGDGSFVTTGYDGSISVIATTTGESGVSAGIGVTTGSFGISDDVDCVIRLTRTSFDNEWHATVVGGNQTVGTVVGGTKIGLTNSLDRIRLTTVAGTASFDAGTVRVLAKSFR